MRHLKVTCMGICFMLGGGWGQRVHVRCASPMQCACFASLQHLQLLLLLAGRVVFRLLAV